MGDPDFELDPAGLGRALELLGEHFASRGRAAAGRSGRRELAE